MMKSARVTAPSPSRSPQGWAWVASSVRDGPERRKTPTPTTVTAPKMLRRRTGHFILYPPCLSPRPPARGREELPQDPARVLAAKNYTRQWRERLSGHSAPSCNQRLARATTSRSFAATSGCRCPQVYSCPEDCQEVGWSKEVKILRDPPSSS